MKSIPTITRQFTLSVAAIMIPLFSGAACAAESEEWQFRASVYAWLPSLAGETNFTIPGSPDGGDGSVDMDRILDSIESAFMGGLSAKKGRWGVFADYIYLDLSDTTKDSRALDIGDIGIPGELGYKTTLGITGWVLNAAGAYTVVDNDMYSMNLLAGVRYLDLEEELDWEVSAQTGNRPENSLSGNIKIKDQVVDAIIGVHGEVKFGQSNWSAPYHFDVGTGDTEYSLQGAVGINYAFSSFDVRLSYRYLEWNLDSDAALEYLSFSGAQIGVGYSW